jgi:alkylation response protein AidB-like acyl-CoA dehydrogenase
LDGERRRTIALFRVFRIRREVAAEGVSEVRSQIPLSRGGPLANLLRLDPESLQQFGQMARGHGVALGVVGPRPILEGGQVADGGGCRQSVGRGGGEEVAQIQVAEAAILLDASRALVYTTSRAVDGGMDTNQLRRLISETKKFVTESCQKVVHNAMQVVGGIGYTNVLPLERIYRDIRLASIWTGTNEVMAMIVAHEWYREVADARSARLDRDYAADAPEAEAAGEIIYE